MMVALIGETRRTSRDLGWVADYLALRPVSAEPRAAVWPTRGFADAGQRFSLAHSPAGGRFGSAENLLAAIDRLDLDDDHAPPGEDA